MFLRISQTFILTAILSGFFIQSSFAGLDQFDVSNSIIDLQEFMSGGPAKDGIPSLDKPQFVSADKVDFLQNDDQVVGVVINGQAKAYPIQVLNWHEIVNDQISNRSVAITWCPLTHSAVVFDRAINGKDLEFGVSGLLYNSNVVMYDRQFQGLWSQLKMGGLTGRFSKNHLNVIPSRVSTWEDWRQQYPQTFILSKKTGHQRDYNRDPYASYHVSENTMFSAGFSDNRLQPKSLVVGVKIGNVAKAYPLNGFARQSEPLEDSIAEVNIRIRSFKGGSIEVSDKNGNILPSVVAYWFAWSAFNKDTIVYGVENQEKR